MKPLTFRQVLEALQELSPDQLDCSASILDTTTMEVHPVYETILMSELPEKFRQELEGVVDWDQPLMTIGSDEPVHGE